MKVIVLLIFGAAGLLFIPAFRRGFLERVKALSDALLLRLLRSTSGFESELTRDGAAEQRMHREQRLRNLRGLALREKEKIATENERARARQEKSNR